MKTDNPYEAPQVSNDIPMADEVDISWADSVERRFRILFFVLATIAILLILFSFFVMLIGT